MNFVSKSSFWGKRWAERKGFAHFLAAVPIAAALVATPAHAGLTFVTTFESTVDAAAQAVINGALAEYSALFSDNVTVSLNFKNSGSGLGSSSTYGFTVDYADYHAKLVADATSAADATALGLLPAGAVNPVNGTGSIFQGRAGLAAVGIFIDTSGIAGYLDGDIDLNLGLMNYDRLSIDPSKYDLKAVVQHEVNEVLGTISAVGRADPRPVDLFRYDDTGARSFTTSGDNAYFSIDGSTLLARYNQSSGGDYGDWWSCCGAHTYQVQDAFSSPGLYADLGVELTLLDVIGWTRITTVGTVPEPGSLALVLFAGLIGVAARRRKA